MVGFLHTGYFPQEFAFKQTSKYRRKKPLPFLYSRQTPLPRAGFGRSSNTKSVSPSPSICLTSSDFWKARSLVGALILCHRAIIPSICAPGLLHIQARKFPAKKVRLNVELSRTWLIQVIALLKSIQQHR
jgi:hypothetical protein